MKTVFIKKTIVAALTSTALLAVLPMAASAAAKTDGTAVGSQSKNSAETANQTNKKEWIYKNGNWYFKVNDSYIKGWLESEGYWYYFDNQGVMVHNTTIKIDGKAYVFDSNGILRQ